MSKTLQPYLLGRGNAGQAMARCLALLPHLDSELSLLPPIWLERGKPLEEAPPSPHVRLLGIANPHALHAPAILEGAKAGFGLILTDKPAAVSPEQVEALRPLGDRVHVCHGYRQTWGPRQLKTWVDSGELGEIVAIEGRYWQASAAEKALAGNRSANAWKNDPSLSGPFDTFLDLGAHWVDLVQHLLGERAESARAWLHHANGEASHRDTHVQLEMNFSGRRRAWASLSKTFHGKGNQLEIHVLGSKAAASWSFERPDEIVLARGAERHVHVRKDSALGLKLPPFHGAGWLEGYGEILKQTARRAVDLPSTPVPTLAEHLSALDTLFSAERV
jgi:predicted dehydrogenase